MKVFIVCLSIVMSIATFRPILAAESAPALKEHAKKLYINDDKQIFVPHNKGVYLRLSLSSDEGAPSALLQSESSLENKNYDQSFSFEGPGQHTIEHPQEHYWKVANPRAPRLSDKFLIHVDKAAPKPTITISPALKVVIGPTTVFGKAVSLNLQANDDQSGTEGVLYSINNVDYQQYSTALELNEDIDYLVRYYAVDHVGNVSKVRIGDYAIDTTPPTTTHQLQGNVEEILSPRSKIRLNSKDKRAGVANTYYAFGQEQKLKFIKYKKRAWLNVKNFKEGNHQMKYFSVDRLENGEKLNTFEFYLDRTAPTTSYVILKDEYRGDRLYVSERSTFQLEATDNKVGVKDIRYTLNGKRFLYGEPFPLSKTKRNHELTFFSRDLLDNASTPKKIKIVLDIWPPTAKLVINGIHYFNNNIHYITSSSQISVTATDALSGLQFIQFKTDQLDFAKLESPFTISQEGPQSIVYYATDNVNNNSNEKSENLYVDNTPPEIFIHFSVPKINADQSDSSSNDIYPPKTSVYLAATDQASGVKGVTYSVNGAKERAFKGAISFNKSGTYTVLVRSVDNVKNESSKSVTFDVQ